MEMDPVVHFEMPAEDRKRMASFYAKAFGWKTHELGPEMGNYVLATTTQTDEKGMVKTPGTINGGFFQKTKEMGPIYPSIVISVKDIKAAVKKVTQEGGKVLGDPMEIPGVGIYANFVDTEGNRVGMMQPMMK